MLQFCHSMLLGIREVKRKKCWDIVNKMPSTANDLFDTQCSPMVSDVQRVMLM